MKANLSARLKRGAKVAVRKAAELKDRFRRRNTEKPHLAGVYKKGQVMIGKPELIFNSEGRNVFQAEFIRPRVGSQLNPYADHIIGPAVEIASHQLVVSALKRFGGIKGVSMPSILIRYKVKKPIPPKGKIIIRVLETSSFKVGGKKIRSFKSMAVDAGNEKTVYLEGKFAVVLVDKNKVQ